MRNVFDAALDLILPSRCAGCGNARTPSAAGAAETTGTAETIGTTALCGRCHGELFVPRVVHRALAHRDSVGPGGPVMYALGRYRHAARAAVLAYKESGRRELVLPFAQALAAAIRRLPSARPDADGTWWLVPAPSVRVRARQRGGAHMDRLTRATASVLTANGALAVSAPCLHLDGSAQDSVGLSVQERVANLAGRVSVVPAQLPPAGTPVVLVDDVITSGATVRACSAALQGLAARLEVTVAVALTDA